MSDWVSQVGAGRDFVIFNVDELDDELVGCPDFEYVGIPSAIYESMVWSCDIDWYFVVVPQGIVLCRVHTRGGLLCRKKSFRFIEWFLDYRGKPQKEIVRRGL